MINNNILVYY